MSKTRRDDHETFIRVHDGVVPASYCQQLIALFQQSPLVKAGKAQTLSGDTIMDDHKICDELHIRSVLMEEKDPSVLQTWKRVDEQLFSYVNPLLAKYIEEFQHLEGQPMRDEGFRFKRYPKQQGRFGLHVDMTPNTPTRVMAVILYLNDVAQGGETVFPRQNTKVKPRCGRVALSPAFWTHPHQGEVPQSQDKFIVNNFAMF